MSAARSRLFCTSNRLGRILEKLYRRQVGSRRHLMPSQYGTFAGVYPAGEMGGPVRLSPRASHTKKWKQVGSGDLVLHDDPVSSRYLGLTLRISVGRFLVDIERPR